MTATRESGVVASFGKRFGFIRPDAGGPDLFVHRAHITHGRGARWWPGARCSFLRGADDQGRPMALAMQKEREGAHAD